MALREDQIQRYGRQILLREVGGAGQRKLLAAPVLISATSPAADVATTYLVAGGSPVVRTHQARTGFLTGTTPDALSPDASAGLAPVLELSEGLSFPRGLPTVALLEGAIALVTPTSCPACWASRPASKTQVDSVACGSVAALLIQRWVLGWAQTEALLVWDGVSLRDQALPRCDQHRA